MNDIVLLAVMLACPKPMVPSNVIELRDPGVGNCEKYILKQHPKNVADVMRLRDVANGIPKKCAHESDLAYAEELKNAHALHAYEAKSGDVRMFYSYEKGNKVFFECLKREWKGAYP